jgi:serine/threonine protein kinase
LTRKPQPVYHEPKLDDFEILCVLGRGSWGKVMKARMRSTGDIYALKRYKLKTIFEQNRVQNTLDEIRIHKKLDNPFIAQLHYAFTTEKKLYLVMDFMEGGDLYFHIEKEKKFTISRAKFYIAQVILAVEYLHKNGIVKRAIKPEDIVIDDKGYLKLLDIGLAKDGMVDYSTRTYTFCGTPEYLAPEILVGNGYGMAVDWWAVGVLLFEMIFGHVPFYNTNIHQMYESIVTGELKFPKNASLYVRDIISRFLDRDPNKRLGTGPNGIVEIKNHPFFIDFDWNSIDKKKQEAPMVPKLTHDKQYISNDFLNEEAVDSDAETPDQFYEFGYHFWEENWPELRSITRFTQKLRFCNAFLDIFISTEH